jgi:hypothetical protein
MSSDDHLNALPAEVYTALDAPFRLDIITRVIILSISAAPPPAPAAAYLANAHVAVRPHSALRS